MHQNKAAVNLLKRLSLASPVVYGRVSDTLVEERAERTQALEPDFETNVGHTQTADAQQLFGLLNSYPDQVLAWSRVERLAKRAQEVVRREAGFFGNFV